MRSTDVFEAIDAVSLSPSQDALTQIFEKAIAAEGFDHFIYGLIPNDPALVTGPELTNWRPDWMEHFLDQRYMEVDPTLRLRRPMMVWNAPEVAVQDRTRTGRFAGEAIEAGISHGFIFATPVTQSARLIFSVAGEHSDCLRADFRSLHLLTLACWMRGRQIGSSGSDGGVLAPGQCLSDRERDCLRWVALGKTLSEVADIMTLSERTVRFHLGNARAKLGSTTTNLAITKALVSGEIIP